MREAGSPPARIKDRVRRAAAQVLPPAAVLVALAATFETLLHGDRIPLFRDLLFFFLPLKQYLAERLAAGEVPLWNPWILVGTPFLAALQTGVFYPPSLLLLLPFPAGFDLFLFVHYLIAAAGAFALLRSRSLSPAACVIGTLVYALGGYLVSTMNVTNNLQSAAWAPWLMFAWSRLLDRPGRWRFAALVAVTVLQLLGGAPETLALMVIVIASWTACCRVAGAGNLLRPAAMLIAALSAAAGLTALQIVPTAELLAHSPRGSALTFAEVSTWSLQPVSLLQLLFPHSSALVTPEEAWGIGRLFESVVPWLSSLYLGVVPLCLVIVGVTGGRERRFWGAVAGLGLLLALGSNTPLLAAIYHVAPGVLGKFRYPEKFYFLVSFATMVLVAEGAERLFARDLRAERIAWTAIAALGSVAAAVRAFEALEPVAFLHFISILKGSAELSFATVVGLATDLTFKAERVLVLLGLFALALLCRRWSVVRPAAFAAIVALLAGADLASTHHDLNLSLQWAELEPRTPIVDVAELRRTHRRIFHYQTSSASFPGTPSGPIRGLEEGPSAIGGSDTVKVTAADLWPALAMNVPSLYGVGTVGGADGIGRSSHDVLRNVLTIVPRPLAVKLLRILGTEYLIGSDPLDDVPVTVLDRFRQGHSLRQSVYRIRDPLPLAYLVGRLHVATGDKDAFNRMIDPSFVPGAEAVVAGLPPGWQDTGDTAPVDGSVTFVSYEGERVVLAVRTARQALLVLSDADYPGWEATVDGAPRPIVRTNVLVRGVLVPPGDHTVEFRYDPRSFRLGMWISLVTLVVLAGALASMPTPSRSWPGARV